MPPSFPTRRSSDLVQRGLFAQAAYQVGVGDERFAEGDQVGLARFDVAFGQVGVVVVVGHPGALVASLAVGLAQRGVVERLVALLEVARARSEEHTSELQSLMRISYAVFCLK